MASYVCLLFLCALSGTLAQNPALWRSVRSADNGTSLAEARLASPTDVAASTTYPWIVSIYVPAATAGSPATDYGPAVVIKKNYVIAHSDLHSSVTDANIKTLRVAAGSLFGDVSADLTTLITRRVKSRVSYKTDPAVTSEKDFESIAIFKVCPSFPDSSLAVVATVSPATGDPLILVNYEPKLQSVTKTVGEDCECDEYAPPPSTDYATYYVPRTFCGAEDATHFIETGDKPGTIAIVNDKFAGFNTLFDHGELFIDYLHADYQAWVTTNTPA